MVRRGWEGGGWEVKGKKHLEFSRVVVVPYTYSNLIFIYFFCSCEFPLSNFQASSSSALGRRNLRRLRRRRKSYSAGRTTLLESRLVAALEKFVQLQEQRQQQQQDL